MFALKFDTLKRKMKESGVTLTKLETCFEGTPQFEAWLGLLDSPQDDNFQFITEEDGKTHTFFRINND